MKNRLDVDYYCSPGMSNKAMTRKEAIQALSNGQRVRHAYFTDEEWVEQDGCYYIFEDGVHCNKSDFWSFRSGGAWENDWEVVSRITPMISPQSYIDDIRNITNSLTDEDAKQYIIRKLDTLENLIQ